jgi:SAM-dependent methyltransferase
MPDTLQSGSDILRREAQGALEQGDTETAERRLAEALKRNAKDHRALALMAEVRLQQKNLNEAFSLYRDAVNAAPQVHWYKKRFLNLAGLGVAVNYSESLANALVACLKTPDLASLLENWSRLLLAEPRFHAAYGLTNRQDFDPSNRAFFAGLTDFRPLFTPLFLEGIKSNVVCSPVFEEFITHIRRHLLFDLEPEGGRVTPEQFLALATALSHYAFLTDFILDSTEDEKRRTDELRRRVETENHVTNDPAAVAVLACYQPLHTLKNAELILDNFKTSGPLADVVKSQIADLFALREAASSIQSVTDISEGVSAQVRELYESFPYPRWKTISAESLEQDWQKDECSRKAEGPLRGTRARILVAGCGTGRDTAVLAAIFPDAIITAVDLSRTSLAYASIRAEEHGLKNISFRHGDILKLTALGGAFDYISSTGVLHHMENPVEGWRVLCGLLKPGGLMRIGLYSEIGRKGVVAAHEAIKRANYPSSPEGIARFRRESPDICGRQTLLDLARLRDYYNMNMYRDLLFHFQEYRFDTLQIEDVLRELGLAFEGFNISAGTLAKYRDMFPDDPSATNLERWNRFERTTPQTFLSGYAFWCRKAGG